MNIIYDERGSGKTTKLIYLSYFKQIPIIVVCKDKIKYLLDKAEEYGLSIPKPISIFEILNDKYKGRLDGDCLVDDGDGMLDLILFYKARLNIDTMTISSERIKK